jgi:membrane protein implicated in regulation of membrane protease activity
MNNLGIDMDFLNELWNPAVVWFITGLLLLLLELAAPGLVLFFFGIGAWVTALLYLTLGINIDLQLIVFVVSSFLLLITLRRYVQKLFKGKTNNTGSNSSESLVGERGVVITAITPPNRGKVEVHGTNWSAESDLEIASGTTVIVTEQNNIIIKVRSLS